MSFSSMSKIIAWEISTDFKLTKYVAGAFLFVFVSVIWVNKSQQSAAELLPFLLYDMKQLFLD